MLKQLLKYEFKATKSLYFGLYLALALLSVVLGVSFRQENARARQYEFRAARSHSDGPLSLCHLRHCGALFCRARSSAFIKICWDVKAT